MHVSLTRRSHRIGQSLQLLLWICFGVLAIVPWQAICGADDPVNPAAEQSVDIEDPADRDPPDVHEDSRREFGEKPTGARSPVLSDSASSLIFRGQNGPFDAGTQSPFQPQPGLPPQSPFPPQSQFPPQQNAGPFGTEQLSGSSGEAFGVLSRVGALTGPGIGRKNPLFPLEFMPYMFADNNIVFADVRGFRSSQNYFGGNFGVGYRRYVSRWDRILGVNAYYDYDNTSSVVFRQLGLGLESLGELFDVRANGYFPTGTSAQELSLVNVNGTQKFVGHNLVINQLHTTANSLHGFDTEIGVPLPGPAFQRHDVRFFGGGYWYECNNIPGFGGFKTRIQGNVIPSVAMQLEVTHDVQFKTNVIFGASWTFGGYKQSDGQAITQYNRMTTPVQRNYNIVVGESQSTDVGVTVINPATNNPYFIEHVDSNAIGAPVNGVIGNGTVEHPFAVFADAQNVPVKDIIFVHANSVFTGIGVTLQPDVRVLGEASGIEHEVSSLVLNSSSGLDNFILLPHPTAIPTGATFTSRPLFRNSPTDGVVLANNSEFSGFQIGLATDPLSGPAGRGIVGDSISNAVVRQTDVSFSGGDGVFLNKTGGTILFLGDTINDPSSLNATTFHVASTTTGGQIRFAADTFSTLRSPSGAGLPTPGVINNVVGIGGSALVVETTATGSSVDLTGSTVNEQFGQGIMIKNNAGAVSLGDIVSTNATDIALDILNDAGAVTENGTVSISNATGDSIRIQGLTATGRAIFTGLDSGTGPGIAITNRQARGIFLSNNAGNVSFLTPVAIAAPGAVNLAAIEYQGSSGDVEFVNNLTITNGNAGILIGTTALDANGNGIFNTGHFTTDATTIINNPLGIGIEVTNDKSRVAFNSGLNSALTINQRGSIGIEILNNRGPVTFGTTTTVTNANAVTLPGVDIRGNQILNAIVDFATLNISNATGPASPGFGGIGLNIGGRQLTDANAAQVTINQLDVLNSTGGTAVFVDNEGQQTATATTGLAITGGTITAFFGPAIDIENSIINTRFTSISSTQSPTTGITLVDNQSFTQLSASVLNDFMFQVVGTGVNTTRNGGFITQATGDGVSITQNNTAASNKFFHTGDVSLNQLSLIQNNRGINANGLLQLTVADSAFTQNTVGGILATDIPRIDITTSSFIQNAPFVNGNAIRLTATTTLPVISPTAGVYNWNITDNQNANNRPVAGFVGSGLSGDLVVVNSSRLLQFQDASNVTQVTPLIFHFDRNNEILQIANGTGVAVNWIGPESGSINQNTFLLRGGDTAIGITNSDSTSLTNYSILGNNVTAIGGSNIGIDVNNFGPTQLFIGDFLNANGTRTASLFNFTSPVQPFANVTTADIAMQFSILNSSQTLRSNIDFFNNQIVMTGQNRDQGIVFSTLQAPATLTFDNNRISVDARPNAPYVGMGIDIQSIIGTANLVGGRNNIITTNGANTIPNNAGVISQDWVRIIGSTTGQFVVNGFSGP